ncbi:hypothetical protein HMPREF3172_08710 [Brevibacterium sp. HMSC08F02]|uniref:sarcosine oxidase subunit gamma n=1 Tax=Brevibacterium sp. HMSC08F02 TaxID=1581140 RepID=UPI0008A36924|nr:sarcosine oxidase subunit gamma family protein [Brevibacterium sp. HMSC08F02]OFT25125.1 hypothetical protein HMPREF3172_08710 [Brevibacterium sp. HMSC08F02]
MADNTAVSQAEVSRQDVLSLRRSPLAERAAELDAAGGPRVRLREVPFRTQISLRAEPGGPAADGLENVLGAPLPRKVGQVSEVEAPVTGYVLWFGPDDFLLVAGDEAERELSCSALAGILAEAVGEHRGQAVDLSGNRTVLELSGPNAVDVLCRMVEVDVHPDFFPVGSAILTLVAGSSAALWRTGEDSYWIMPRASFADHTANWLLDAMREFADRG